MKHTFPSIDHSMLSPSGRVSKRARAAAMQRESARLFPPGYFDRPEPSAEDQCRAQAEALRRSAANLRDLAARGMSPRKFVREAARLEAEADALATGYPVPQTGLPARAFRGR